MTPTSISPTFLHMMQLETLIPNSTTSGLWFLFALLSLLCIAVRKIEKKPKEDGSANQDVTKLTAFLALRRKYLPAILLFKLADWLQGPYFYQVYRSMEDDDGKPILSTSNISTLFVVGFASSMLLGSSIGSLIDKFGRKLGCLLCGILGIGSCLVLHSQKWHLLVLGRVCGGTYSALLYTAFEAWLASAASTDKVSEGIGTILGEQQFYDGLCAIAAGVVADFVAEKWSVTAVFNLSALCFALGSAVVMTTWSNVHTAPSQMGKQNRSIWGTISSALSSMTYDVRIPMLGLVQTMFEGSMYCFVMMWAPAVIKALEPHKPPFGLIFSCFMLSTSLGSAFFGLYTSNGNKNKLSGALTIALALASAALLTPVFSLESVSPFPKLVVAFCIFEACVGIYFPRWVIQINTIGYIIVCFIYQLFSVLINFQLSPFIYLFIYFGGWGKTV